MGCLDYLAGGAAMMGMLVLVCLEVIYGVVTPLWIWIVLGVVFVLVYLKIRN